MCLFYMYIFQKVCKQMHFPFENFNITVTTYTAVDMHFPYTGLSKKMDGIWNRYNLKSTGRIYTFGILKCSEKFKVLDLP